MTRKSNGRVDLTASVRLRPNRAGLPPELDPRNELEAIVGHDFGRDILFGDLIKAAAIGGLAVSLAFAQNDNRQMLVSANDSGMSATVSTGRVIDTKNPFFQSLGANGRACVTCHQMDSGWTITPENVQRLFAETAGLDPVFRVNDGSNNPFADTSTVEKRRAAYSMLLSKALIRVGLPIPPKAEFELAAVDDPYGFASASELSLFRRPLPAANLRFLSAVMWDGRETVVPITGRQELLAGLEHQSIDATVGHAQAAAPPTAEQVRQIVEFEMGLHTAQVFDKRAGSLIARGAKGGPVALSGEPFFIGINDPLGGNPSGASFNPEAMTVFTKWRNLAGPSNDVSDIADLVDRNPARQSAARGERIFNTRPIAISGVAGLNDALNLPVLPGTCTTCHDAPNAGNHSVALPINIGTADASRRTPDLPLYTLRNKVTGAMVQTTDPGRALISGKWTDIGKFKGPVLRGLASRAPYFHNGSAATLADAVDFYDTRFGLALTAQEREDLVAFLRSL